MYMYKTVTDRHMKLLTQYGMNMELRYIITECLHTLVH